MCENMETFKNMKNCAKLKKNCKNLRKHENTHEN